MSISNPYQLGKESVLNRTSCPNQLSKEEKIEFEKGRQEILTFLSTINK